MSVSPTSVAVLTKSKTSKIEHFPSLDGLRALSISLVLLGHLSGTRGFVGVDLLIGDYAHLAVVVFFVISGFLITRLMLLEHARNIVVDSSQPLNFELKPAGNRLVIELTAANSAPTAANAARPSTSTGQDVATHAVSKPVNTPQAETPKKAPAPMLPANPSAQSSPRPSAYVLQAKARELKLEELQPLEDKVEAGDPEAETTLGLAVSTGRKFR